MRLRKLRAATIRVHVTRRDSLLSAANSNVACGNVATESKSLRASLLASVIQGLLQRVYPLRRCADVDQSHHPEIAAAVFEMILLSYYFCTWQAAL